MGVFEANQLKITSLKWVLNPQMSCVIGRQRGEEDTQNAWEQP